MKMLKVMTHPVGLLLSIVSLGAAGAFAWEFMVRALESMLSVAIPRMDPIVQTDWPRLVSRVVWSIVLSSLCVKLLVVVLDLIRFSRMRKIVDMTPLDNIDASEHKTLLEWSMRDDNDDIEEVWGRTT